MRFSRLPAATVLALALGGTAAALATTPALASSPTPTEITGFASSPAQISVGHTQITLSGRVVETDHTSVGVAGAKVDLSAVIGGNVEILPTVTTGADGTFTYQLPATVGGYFGASSEPGPGYAASSNLASVKVTSAGEPTRITLNPQPKSLVWSGTDLTFTGKAEAEASDGQWHPLVTSPRDADDIEISVNGVRRASAVTKADGTFTVSFPAGDGGKWQAAVFDDWGSTYSLYRESSSNAVVVDAQHRTWVSSWSVAVKSAAHRTVAITGLVQGQYGTPWRGVPGLTVTYYYQDLPSTRWIKAGSARTNADDVFKSVLTAKAGHLRWHVVVARQNLSGDVYLATTTGTHDTVIRG
ncbi:MAG: hypothetical protein JWM19_5793 [Actinomycetia bacterium]|nr:hypothetical protein [Actinomycetes bacterium]